MVATVFGIRMSSINVNFSNSNEGRDAFTQYTVGIRLW